MVDAGANAATFRSFGILRRDITSVEEGLRGFGLSPADIDIVIVTHLHSDHIALGSLYPNARFVVQRKELDYARRPHILDSMFYRPDMFESLKLESVDGETEIAPGVATFLTPGHSPGGQSVEITTKVGKVVITGFCCFMSNFEQTDSMAKMGWEVAAPELHQDCRDAYDSVLQVKARGDVVVPLHDPAFISVR